MSQHTPGPWIIKDDDQYDHVFTAAKPHRRIANVYGGVKGSNDLDLQNQANARLIAAAPELLAACQAFVDSDCQDGVSLAFSMAIDAITKATEGLSG